MKRGIFHLLPLITVFILPLISQSEHEAPIRHIQEQYNEIKKQISSGQLYCNEFILNRDKLPVSAVGNYQETVRFYHTRDPMSGTHELRMIILKGERSITQTHAEFLYNPANQLIFYFYRLHIGQGHTTRSRCYFKGNRLIRLIDNDLIIDDPGEKYEAYRDAIIKRSRELRSLFLKSAGFSLSDIEDLKQ